MTTGIGLGGGKLRQRAAGGGQCTGGPRSTPRLHPWARTGAGFAAVVAWAVAACGGTVEPMPAPQAPLGPSAAVESFLEAAARRDLSEMARWFGTPDGPLSETGGTLGCALRKIGSWVGIGEACPRWSEVELRMNLLAAILAPSAYRVRAQEQVAGVEHPSVRVFVDVTVGGREASRVPFVVVMARDSSWLVQQIELERLTG